MISHLDRFPVDVLKVDRSFISQLGNDSRGTRIVPAVIGLARALDVVTVAEGVEAEAQSVALDALGCQMAQGFHFAAPAPPEAMTDVLHGMRSEAPPHQRR